MNLSSDWGKTLVTTVDTPEGVISYQVSGHGSPLVFLPGFQSSSMAWVMYGYPDHFEGFKSIMIDPLGHGKSEMSHDPHDYAINKTVGQITAVLDQEGIDRRLSLAFLGVESSLLT